MSIWFHISKLLESLIAGEALSELFKRLRTPPEKTVGFTIAVIALSAKIAKADGIVTKNEIIAFKQIFHIPLSEEKNAMRVFNLAQQDIAGFDLYAKKIARMLKNNKTLLEHLIEGLLYISVADGVFHPDEEGLIDNISKIFDIPSSKLNILKAWYVPDLQKNPFLVLGISPAAGLKEIKKQWQTLVHESHPDNMIAQGLPQEAINLATTRLIAINTAWNKIKRNATKLELNYIKT